MENSCNHDVPSWTRMMTQCQMERDAFKKQVKKLTARLQGAEIYCSRQDAKVKQLTTEKERRMIQTESLQGEVEHLNDHLYIGTSSRQQEERCIMQNQVRVLNELLGRASAINFSEHELRLKIWEELERTKKQLARQETLKKRYRSKEKVTRRKLKRLKMLSDAKTIDNLKYTTNVHRFVKRKEM